MNRRLPVLNQYSNISAEQRFELQMQRSGGCWEWVGPKNGRGYGQFYFEGRLTRAHRTSYRMHIGPIPDGMVVCHRCDNPSCVNPAHLFIGSQKDNVVDCVKKGRRADKRGENNGHATITTEQALTIKQLWASGLSCLQIAKVMGVSRNLANSICHGRSWKHI